MISYEDVSTAAEWLVRAFGLREELRYEEPNGRVSHVELRLGEGSVMLGNPSLDCESPKRHPATSHRRSGALSERAAVSESVARASRSAGS